MKRRYRRYFIMLEEKDKGFNNLKLGGIKAYVKIEIKNLEATLSFYCQNLKALDEKKARYRLYLIHTKESFGSSLVDIGPISVDKNGKSEFIWDFKAENVKGQNRAIDDYDVLCLVVENIENPHELHVPLVGYIHKEKSDWKPVLEKNLFIKPQATIQTQAIENNEKDKPSTSIVEDKEKDGEQSEPIESMEYPEVKPTQAQENFDMQLGVSQDDRPQIQISPTQEYIENTLMAFPKEEPFEKNLDKCEWWQIHYNNQTIFRSYMPFISYIEMLMDPSYQHTLYYPISDYRKQFHKYQHYFFGISYDTNRRANYYIYALPGKNHPSDQPFAGTTGFVHWHPCHNKEYQQDDFGYWLMHINAHTFEIENPLDTGEK